MRDLTGKYCIVTGAGKGIGKAIAKRFLMENAAGVAILEWNLELAQATAKELDPTGEKVIAVKCNVADSDMVKAAIDETVRKFGRIDVLINNAGVTRDRIFHKMTDEEWHTVIDINLNGVYNMCKFVVPMMREQESGAIVNISSTSLQGNPGQANYAATKAALQGLTRTLGKELGRKNVRVNCIAPGGFDPGLSDNPAKKQFVTNYIENCPLGCWANEDDIKGPVVFLASKAANYVTGATLVMDGGWTIW